MIERILAYAVVGLAIGILSGLFGVGGSSISTPVLRLALEVPPLIALATPLPVTIPTAISGGLTYYRRGLADLRVAAMVTAAGIPSVIAGAVATAFISGHSLMVLTGVVVLGIGMRLAWSAITIPPTGREARRVPKRYTALASALIGLVVGFFSGLLANGGGFLLVPAFIFLLGMSMHEAAGTSLICVAGFAIPGSLTHWFLGHIDLILMLSLGIAVIPAAYVGARLALSLGTVRVQLLYGLFLVVFAIYFLYSEVMQTA